MTRIRLTPHQHKLLAQLPRLGEEWLDVELWSRKNQRSLNTLARRGLTDIWWHGNNMHARLTWDGQQEVDRHPSGSASEDRFSYPPREL